MHDPAYLRANIGQIDRFLAGMPAARRLERMGFESLRAQFAAELAAHEALALALFGWLP